MAAVHRPANSEQGQSTPEYVGVVLAIAMLLAGLLTLAGDALPGGGVARALASKLVCAVKETGECGGGATELAARPSPVEEAYGAELATLIAKRTPAISFEDDEFVSLPVDFRECRERACADTILHGSIEHTQAGHQPTAFVHVVDCRDPEVAVDGYDCTGARAGNAYIQYWLYYPESWTRSFQRWGFHVDDWESFQVRIGPDGAAVARASSHHGYNGRDGDKINDAGWGDPQPAWDTILDQLHVAAGSHAGTSQNREGDSRRIEPGNIRIVPLEPVARGGKLPRFEVSPPWEKEVWDDPEATGT